MQPDTQKTERPQLVRTPLVVTVVRPWLLVTTLGASHAPWLLVTSLGCESRPLVASHAPGCWSHPRLLVELS